MKRIILYFLLLFIALPSFSQPCTPNPFSISFNGTSAYIKIDTAACLDLTNTVTVEAWIYASQWTTSVYQGSIVSKDGWSAGEFGYVLRAGGNGQLSFVIGGVDTNGTPASWTEALSAPTMLLNTWYHVAGTFDGNAVKCYINGTMAGSASFTGTILTSAGFPMRIGMFCDTAHGQRYWNGLIDEVRVWSAARSQTEIQANMGTHLDTSLTQNALVGYWRFNDGFVPVVQDLSGYNHGGTLFNCGPIAIVPFNATPPQIPLISYAAGVLHCNATGTGPFSYQWYLGGNLINGANQVNYTPTQYGNYTVKITAPNGCTSTSPAFIYNTTGIDIFNMDNGITLVPNPAKDRVEVNCPGGISQLKLYDLGGREILSASINETNHYVLNLHGLQTGLYILKGSKQDSGWVRKLVITD